jgi:hypothetical protein
MAHPKEKCFSDALEKYKSAKEFQGKPVDWGFSFQQTWVQQTQNRLWTMSKRPWFVEAASQRLTRLHKTNPIIPSGSTLQFRIPDLTLFLADAATWVLDLKFTRPGGGVDDWTNVPGGGNGNTQVQDINGMNKQLNPGQEMKDPKLHPDTCNCKQRQKVRSDLREHVEIPQERWEAAQQYVMAPRLYVLPIPASGALGAFGSVGASAPWWQRALQFLPKGAAAGAQPVVP